LPWTCHIVRILGRFWLGTRRARRVRVKGGDFGVSDIFQEVDEEVRREQLNKLWQRYQNLVIALVVLILAGVGGWRYYEYRQATRAAELGTAFEEAATLAEQGKHAESAAAFAKVASEGNKIYRQLALMRQAAELVQTDRKAGIAAYDVIAGDSSVSVDFKDLAGVRAGELLIDDGTFNEARPRLEPLATAGRPYRHSARELLALAAWRSGDIEAAKRWFDLIVSDIQTPPSTRDRVEMLIGLVAAEGKS
jgi:hypothetical protein